MFCSVQIDHSAVGRRLKLNLDALQRLKEENIPQLGSRSSIRNLKCHTTINIKEIILDVERLDKNRILNITVCVDNRSITV